MYMMNKVPGADRYVDSVESYQRQRSRSLAAWTVLQAGMFGKVDPWWRSCDPWELFGSVDSRLQASGGEALWGA